MAAIVSDRTRTILFHSLGAVEAAKELIIDGIARSFSTSEAVDARPEEARTLSTLLVTMLIEQVRNVLESKSLQEIDLIRAKHQLHAIGGRHYSQFGDVLGPVMSDVLGRHSRNVGVAWCDTFWAVIRRMQEAKAAA